MYIILLIPDLKSENTVKIPTDVRSALQYEAVRQAGYFQVPLCPQTVQLILHYVVALR